MGSELVESLKESANARKVMEDRFGFVPLSILKLSRGALSKKMFVLQGEVRGRKVTGTSVDVYEKTPEKQERAQERRRLGIIGGVVTANGNTRKDSVGASIMPAELVDFFVKYYAKPGDTYVDPFMGQGVQMQVAKMRGLHYLGMDLSTEFFRYIKAVAAKIDDGSTTISVNHGDSRHPDCIPDGCADFSFHSPPYWDIEFYGDEPEQLGKGTYEEFLSGMEDVARAWLPKFKPGAYHVVNVNDFRRGGKFYAYHADTIMLFQRAGWKLHDTWVIEGLVGGLPRVFAASKNKDRIAPKIHEYALVFRRPE